MYFRHVRRIRTLYGVEVLKTKSQFKLYSTADEIDRTEKYENIKLSVDSLKLPSHIRSLHSHPLDITHYDISTCPQFHTIIIRQIVTAHKVHPLLSSLLIPSRIGPPPFLIRPQ